MYKCYYNGVEYIMATKTSIHEYFEMQRVLLNRFITSFLGNDNGHFSINDVVAEPELYDLSYIKVSLIWSTVKYPNDAFVSLHKALSELQDKQLDFICDSYIRNNNSQIVFNKYGGYCMITKNEADDITPFSFGDENTHEIKPRSKYIVLENDPTLEKDAVKFISGLDADYSYILNLRSYDKDKLTKTLSEFYGNGGKYIYVYTTANDIEQMRFYINCSIDAICGWDKKSGFLTKPLFIFEFSASVTPELKEFLHEVKMRSDVNFTIVGGDYEFL